MNKLRIFYMLDGQEKYEEFKPHINYYNKKMYTDTYRMVNNAEMYVEALRDVGARNIEVRWNE